MIAIADNGISFLESNIDFPGYEQKRIQLLAHIYLPEVADLPAAVLQKRLKYVQLVGDWSEDVVKDRKVSDSTNAAAGKAA